MLAENFRQYPLMRFRQYPLMICVRDLSHISTRLLTRSVMKNLMRVYLHNPSRISAISGDVYTNLNHHNTRAHRTSAHRIHLRWMTLMSIPDYSNDCRACQNLYVGSCGDRACSARMPLRQVYRHIVFVVCHICTKSQKDNRSNFLPVRRCVLNGSP